MGIAGINREENRDRNEGLWRKCDKRNVEASSESGKAVNKGKQKTEGRG